MRLDFTKYQPQFGNIHDFYLWLQFLKDMRRLGWSVQVNSILKYHKHCIEAWQEDDFFSYCQDLWDMFPFTKVALDDHDLNGWDHLDELVEANKTRAQHTRMMQRTRERMQNAYTTFTVDFGGTGTGG